MSPSHVSSATPSSSPSSSPTTSTQPTPLSSGTPPPLHRTIPRCPFHPWHLWASATLRCSWHRLLLLCSSPLRSCPYLPCHLKDRFCCQWWWSWSFSASCFLLLRSSAWAARKNRDRSHRKLLESRLHLCSRSSLSTCTSPAQQCPKSREWSALHFWADVFFNGRGSRGWAACFRRQNPVRRSDWLGWSCLHLSGLGWLPSCVWSTCCYAVYIRQFKGRLEMAF